MKTPVAITIGDFNGIGPELALKAAVHPSIKALCRPVLVGPIDIFRHTAAQLKKRIVLEKAAFPALSGTGVLVVDVGDGIPADVTPGKPTKVSGRTAGTAIERAVELCVAGRTKAMVTAPASKEALHLAGFSFPGQTEMVALLSRSQKVIMMLVSPELRVGLVTVHVGIKDVAGSITREKVLEKLRLMDAALRMDFGVRSPRIAVLGLNPHAGENGHIGSEETEIIVPAVAAARDASIKAEGPFPADAFFGTRRHSTYDAVLAMYHDQGLIPLKLLAFDTAVNVSAGLSIVRTSPDHGTAYDIAGKGKADISSMLSAVRMAVSIAHQRERTAA